MKDKGETKLLKLLKKKKCPLKISDIIIYFDPD